MKILILTSLFCISSFFVNAQLTKTETIKYIQEKVNETEFLKRKYDEKFTYTFTNITFKKDPTYTDKIFFSIKRNFSDNTDDVEESTFLPQYISSIDKSTSSVGDAVGLMRITFTGRNVVGHFRGSTLNHTYSSKNSIYIPYLQGDELHFERLKKAFLHLKEITIQEMEPDPFVK